MRCVIKLGGGVLPDEDAYKSNAQKLKELNADQLIVVVSAQKGKTRELINSVCGYQSGDIDSLEKALKEENHSTSYNNPEVASYLLQGEIDSAHKLAKYLPESTVIDQDNPYFPIIGNSNYLCGEVEDDATRYAARALEDAGSLVVLPGFGGVDKYGNKMLLGSNASDYSASLAASYLDADQLVFAKDVDGVYSQGQKLDNIVLQGQDVGQVLHPKVAGPLYNKNMDVCVGNVEHLDNLVNKEPEYGTRIIV